MNAVQKLLNYADRVDKLQRSPSYTCSEGQSPHDLTKAIREAAEDHARLEAIVEQYRDLMRDLSKYAEKYHGEADPDVGTFADSCGLPICGHHIVRPGKTQCECDSADNPLAKLRERWKALAASSEGGSGDE